MLFIRLQPHLRTPRRTHRARYSSINLGIVWPNFIIPNVIFKLGTLTIANSILQAMASRFDSNPIFLAQANQPRRPI